MLEARVGFEPLEWTDNT